MVSEVMKVGDVVVVVILIEEYVYIVGCKN